MSKFQISNELDLRKAEGLIEDLYNQIALYKRTKNKKFEGLKLTEDQMIVCRYDAMFYSRQAEIRGQLAQLGLGLTETKIDYLRFLDNQKKNEYTR